MVGELYLSSRATFVCLALARPRPMTGPPYTGMGRPELVGGPIHLINVLRPPYLADARMCDAASAAPLHGLRTRRPGDGCLLARSSPVPMPILSYLRVYEPLRAFRGPDGAAVREALDRGPVDAAGA